MTYGGDVSPNECWEMLQAEKSSVLVDVRTRAEWAFVGTPVLTDGNAMFMPLEWQAYPTMEVDPEFVQKLVSGLENRGLGKDTKICFLCRSGVRSLAAANAVAAVGYANTFNVTGGFEGDADENGHRGNRNGWKFDGLPWRQQ